MSYPYIQLIRHLHFGLQGRDVTAIQLALKHAGYRKQEPTGRYGTITRKQVITFKQHHGIDLEPGYDVKTHKALWPSFGAIAYSIYKAAYDDATTGQVRQNIVDAAVYGYGQRDYIHYTQDSRRMQDFGPPPNVPNWTDCSGFVTWCYKVGGGPDPNGLGFDGYGFTGTMLGNGTQASISNLLKADLIFYGSPVSHVALYVGDGRIISHGSEIGPLLLDYSYRSVNSARRYI